MKWLGFSLIVLASSAWGVQMGEGYALRRKALEDVFSVLTGLQGEISSTHAPLPEIFRRLALREGEPWQSFLLCRESPGILRERDAGSCMERAGGEASANLRSEPGGSGGDIVRTGKRAWISGSWHAAGGAEEFLAKLGTEDRKGFGRGGAAPEGISLPGDLSGTYDCPGIDIMLCRQEGFMEISLIFRIAAVGILVSILCQVLKHSGREEHAFLTSMAGLILVLYWLVPYIYELFETIQDLFVQ